MDKKKKIRVVVLFPVVVVVLLVCALLTFVLLTGAAKAGTVVEGSSGGVAVSSPANNAPAAAVLPAMDIPPCKFDELTGLSSSVAGDRLRPLGRPVRILAPNSVMTEDYSAARIDLHTDAGGIVRSVTCG